MHKTIKVFISVIIVIILINYFPIKSFADWVGDAQGFLEASSKEGEDTVAIDRKKLHGASNEIYNMLTSIGMIISVIVGIILGIIYMMSSATDKAKVKESLMPYLVGSFVIFGAFGIWKILINTLDVM